MDMNTRKRPRKLEFNEALLGRLYSNHPKIPAIKASIGIAESGHYGELTLDSYLNYLPEKNYYIIKGIRLATDRNTHFQIDCLLIHPTHLLIIEAKNHSGTIELNENSDQMIQNGDTAYENPMLQAQFQLNELHHWLKRYKFPYQHLEYLVSMTNKNCVLKVEPGSEAHFRVCRGRRLIFQLNGFTFKYKEVIYTPEIIRKMCKLLLKNHVKPSYFFEKIYKISRSEILPGVHCPNCLHLGMKYRRGSWHCPSCGCKSKDAHLKALKDYYLLFGPYITNQQFREFLGLDSMNIASKLLIKLNLPYTGAKKNRVYVLPYEIKI